MSRGTRSAQVSAQEKEDQPAVISLACFFSIHFPEGCPGCLRAVKAFLRVWDVIGDSANAITASKIRDLGKPERVEIQYKKRIMMAKVRKRDTKRNAGYMIVLSLLTWATILSTEASEGNGGS